MSNINCTNYDYTSDDCRNEYCEECPIHYNQMDSNESEEFNQTD